MFDVIDIFLVSFMEIFQDGKVTVVSTSFKFT